ncbi:MGMT family protein, partial [Cronobacter sakazakii]|nr:MGMT family protein [Cronobacter sakazakii]
MNHHDTFPQRVYQIVAAIPEGCVTTYGEVARLAGSPRAARQVGGVLKRLPEG